MQNNLALMTNEFPMTKLWCDSALDDDIAYSLNNGAVGITTNPPIMNSLLAADMELYLPLLTDLGKKMPGASAEALTVAFMKEVCRQKSERWLREIAAETSGEFGRFTLQTDPANYQQTDKLIAQATELGGACRDMQVKLPVSRAGIQAMETCTYQGLSIIATLGFTVSGIVASAAGMQRGLERRMQDGQPTDGIVPYVAVFQGRLDGYLRECAKRRGLDIADSCFDYAGVAVTKKAYGILKARGYRTKIMLGAFRNVEHWHAFIGGDCSMTISRPYQEVFNTADAQIASQIDQPVKPEILRELLRVPEFVQAYDENQPLDLLDEFGGFRETLEPFSQAYAQLVAKIQPFAVG